MINKKSQVRFIVIILIILIAIVGIVLFWNVFSIVVGDKSAEIGSELLAVNLDIKEVILFITGSSKISVQRELGGEMDSLKFAFHDEDGNIEVREVSGILNELETETYHFKPISGLGKINKVSVFPMLENKIGRESVTEEVDLFEVPDSMISWWRFDDSSDFVGENHGVVNEVEIVNSTLKLDGDGYFNVSDNDSLDMNDELTIGAWVKGESDNGAIIEKGDNYKLSLENGKVVFSYNNKKFESLEKIGEDWNHVAISLGQNGFIYVNGEIAGMKELTSTPNPNNLDLKIGKEFTGEIDEVMIFNKALSKEQVDGLYKFGRKQKIF